MSAKAKIGLIGLGVMGENLALNIERNGYPISVYNRTTEKVDAFLAGAAKDKNVFGYKNEREFIESLEKPRKIILLVKAGDPVDSTIAGIKPFLERGDIIIDGGNSYFEDTRRREKALATEGLFFIGSGVSGGEEGALWGPSLMPGGDPNAYEAIRPIWEAISAKADSEPCVTYLGPDGAGHFVKMVHNGIEYGDMQLIAEVYDMLRNGLNITPREIADIFEKWNQGELNSFLIEITAQILTAVDPETSNPLIDMILDKAGQKGTGKWTVECAQELGIPIPTIDAALSARLLSSMKDERLAAAKSLPQTRPDLTAEREKLIAALPDALFASKICSYAQGLSLIKAASDRYKWDVDLAETARIWKGGCIIRASMLKDIQGAFKQNAKLANLLLHPTFIKWFEKALPNWRYVVSTAHMHGIPVLALGSSLSYFDSYRRASLPQNLTQAQRDFFGAHTYQRADKPEDGFVHTDWQKLIKSKTPAK